MNKTKNIFNQLGFFFAIQWIATIIIFIGVSCNFIAIDTNDGMMPFTDDYYYKSPEHISSKALEDFAKPIENKWATDIYCMNIKNLRLCVSIGDIIIVIGMTVLLINILHQTLKSINKKRRKK
jgi:hypothetical protein